MCVLRIVNKSKSYKSLVNKIKVKPYLILDKGEKQYDLDKESVSEYSISFEISNREWNDLQRQVKDAIRKLKKYKKDFRQLIQYNVHTQALLDFPIESKLGKKIWVQVEYFPNDLLKICGEMNINIVISFFKQ